MLIYLQWQPSLTSNSGATILLLRLKNRKKLAIVKKGLQRMAPESILFLNKLHELRVSLQEYVIINLLTSFINIFLVRFPRYLEMVFWDLP